jgi:hypothetical protein
MVPEWYCSADRQQCPIQVSIHNNSFHYGCIRRSYRDRAIAARTPLLARAVTRAKEPKSAGSVLAIANPRSDLPRFPACGNHLAMTHLLDVLHVGLNQSKERVEFRSGSNPFQMSFFGIPLDS